MTGIPSAAPDARGERLPATVVTGFLGSGKTTLVNHILANQQGLRAAVLVNEIGEIAIDNELIIAAGADMVTLGNGCICCSINDDLVDAIFRVLDHAGRVDYLVVETTGLADPLPVILTFLRSEFRDRIRLDSVVSLADAESFSLDLFESKAASNQLRYGDVVLLNKADLVTGERLDEVEARIRALAGEARILRAARCRVPLPLVLGFGRFAPDRHLGHAGHDDEHHHAHGDDGHDHAAEGFGSVAFESDRPFSADRFQDFLNDRLGAQVFRGKGFLWVAENPRRLVFHLVGRRFSLDESDWTGPKRNRLVLIGRHLDARRLRSDLGRCLVDAPPAG